MEGKELNPDVDWQGVHHFDEKEVEAVAVDLRENGRRSPEFASDLPDFLLVSRLQQVESENEELKVAAKDLQLADEFAAFFLGIANEAIMELEERGLSSAYSLRSRFEMMAALIPG